ncbi:MAG: endolytic transglycosylase MltG [Candidatus Peribacteraceae bacterium]|nr:endolytic transglycosylase MltG [Candidatus Peribacteraceae bacterium]MDD5742939.1 endolytic transglycosylase MltG [Candidatus Peribacteraceae bacterium]
MKKGFFLFVLGLCMIAYMWYLHELSALGGSAAVRVTIEQGMSVAQVGSLLQEKGLIRSLPVFKLYMKLHGADTRVQAGTFIFRPNMSVEEITQILRSGKSEEISLTIPEGWTVADIDALLASKGLAQSGAVLDCVKRCDFSTFDFLPPASLKGLAQRGGRLEGYLFPETYFVNEAEFVPKFFLERLLGTFRARVMQEHRDEIAASGHSLHEIITMASLVEAETRTDTERPIVAGILWKRLEAGMPLGVDATVRYILDKPTGAITQSDLETQSPYNTRKFKGLPPGPIESPSLASIRAAMKSQESPYWYYLHDSKGLIHYAATNDEHNENRRRYLR